MFSQYSDKHIQNSITKKIRKIQNSDPVLIEMANSISKKEKLISTLDLLKIHLFSEINRSEINKIKIPDYGRNMIITYLVSSFETYLKKISEYIILMSQNRLLQMIIKKILIINRYYLVNLMMK